ncbi:hypothetical protein D3C85_1024180 [compost metagenome]
MLNTPVRLNIHKDRGSYYDPNEKTVNLEIGERGKKSKWQAEKVVYHEYGHAIDWQKGMRIDGVATKLMEKYRLILSENRDSGYKDLHMRFYADVNKAFANKQFDEIEKITSFADTLMALNVNYGAGHTKQYFSLGSRKEAEFIAHAFENKFIGNSYFKKVAPDLYQEMVDYIEKYLNKP